MSPASYQTAPPRGLWGEGRDLNPRPEDPQSSALPTELPSPPFNGEPGRPRTCDSRLKRPVLYQLSYGLILASLEGFEPPTSGSVVHCAILLRHRPAFGRGTGNRTRTTDLKGRCTNHYTMPPSFGRPGRT